MNGSTITRRGRKSSKRATKPKETPVDLLKLMSEVGGVIDQAMEESAREAALEDIAAGRDVPVWENEKVLWKPAAVAYAKTLAATKRSRR